MNTRLSRTKYETPRIEVQPLRDLPSALAASGRNCRVTPSKNSLSCSHNRH
ncbi:hypothetical protein [Ktedonosporobacter rubrisoli]|uniref:hypothetical protein n=1 Tax=Ktedonosporobacter rubrisoli TaxID=2509675 RepID=UPI0013EE7450|nr:hypothetical protein [Ktedonosporobacter rubrisoli]